MKEENDAEVTLHWTGIQNSQQESGQIDIHHKPRQTYLPANIRNHKKLNIQTTKIRDSHHNSEPKFRFSTKQKIRKNNYGIARTSR